MKNMKKLTTLFLMSFAGMAFTLSGLQNINSVETKAAEFGDSDGFLVRCYAARINKDPTKKYHYNFSLKSADDSNTYVTAYDSGKACLAKVKGSYNADTTYSVNESDIREGTLLCSFKCLSLPNYSFTITKDESLLTCTFTFYCEVFYKNTVIWHSSNKASKDIYGTVKERSWSGSLSSSINAANIRLDTTNADNHSSCTDVSFVSPVNYSAPNIFGVTYEDGISASKVYPYKEGFNFAGYFDQTGNNQYYDSLLYPTATSIDGSKTIYAMFSNIITYQLNGGKGDSNDVRFYGIEKQLQVPTKTGYSFDGWYENPSFEGEPVTSIKGNEVGDRTFYAKWTLIYYSISYDLDGGHEVVPNPTSYSQESGAITLNNPEKEGYTFIGWTGNDVSEPSTCVVILPGSNGDRHYVAHWEIKVCTVSFYTGEGGSEVAPENVEYGSTASEPATPTKVLNGIRYRFIGWFFQTKSSNGEHQFDFSTIITRALSLFAKWESYITDFVNNYMHPEIDSSDIGTGKCISEGWYQDAKTAFLQLNEAEQEAFLNDSEYAEYAARFMAWATAAGETFNGSSFVITDLGSVLLKGEATNIIIAIIISTVTVTLAGIVYVTYKRKRNHI